MHGRLARSAECDRRAATEAHTDPFPLIDKTGRTLRSPERMKRAMRFVALFARIVVPVRHCIGACASLHRQRRILQSPPGRSPTRGALDGASTPSQLQEIRRGAARPLGTTLQVAEEKSTGR